MKKIMHLKLRKQVDFIKHWFPIGLRKIILLEKWLQAIYIFLIVVNNVMDCFGGAST